MIYQSKMFSTFSSVPATKLSSAALPHPSIEENGYSEKCKRKWITNLPPYSRKFPFFGQIFRQTVMDLEINVTYTHVYINIQLHSNNSTLSMMTKFFINYNDYTQAPSQLVYLWSYVKIIPYLTSWTNDVDKQRSVYKMYNIKVILQFGLKSATGNFTCS